MLSIFSLNSTVNTNFNHHVEKIAVIAALVTLIAGLFIFNTMGGPGSFLPKMPSIGWTLTAVGMLFLFDAVRYASISYKKNSNIVYQNRNVTFQNKITLTQQDYLNFQNYQYRGEINLEEANAEGVKFYFGNCDEGEEFGVRDLGWGCAWRSIEICASPYPLQYNFVTLYNRYSKAKNIDRREWAEPGYGKRFFDGHQIPSQLYLFNRENGSDKTPTDQCLRFPSFSDFTKGMMQHFEKNHTPIMVDDGFTAFTIIGVKTTNNGNVILWIADPHKVNKDAGLYYLILDQNGKKLESTGLDNNHNGLSTAQKIDPAKGWMLLFPQVR